jgi:hypothetical protein
MVAKAGRRDWQDMQTRAEEAGLFRQRAEQFGVDQGVIHDAPGLVNDPNVAAVVATVLMFSTTKCKVEELRNFWPASIAQQATGSRILRLVHLGYAFSLPVFGAAPAAAHQQAASGYAFSLPVFGAALAAAHQQEASAASPATSSQLMQLVQSLPQNELLGQK